MSSSFLGGLSRLGLVAVTLLAASVSAGCSDDGVTPTISDDRGPLGDRLPVDERLAIDGLHGAVDAVRDENGRTHIYADSLEDAVRAQGYLMARDRSIQMDFFRRIALGRLAEALSDLDASTVETDIAFRHVGLGRVSELAWEQMQDEKLRTVLEAYSSGVSQLFAELRSGERELPQGAALWDLDLFEDWTPVHTLAMARLQTWLLSYDGDSDIGYQALFDDLRTTFDAGSSDPLVAMRAGFVQDYLRFAPPDPATTIDGFGAIGAASGKLGHGKAAPSPAEMEAKLSERRRDPRFSALMHSARGFTDAIVRARDVFAPDGDFGSNNWAVSPELSASGHAMVASDPHLSLSSPPVFWPVSIHIGADPDTPSDDQVHIAGIAFSGIPGIVLGHNRHVAWGATVTAYDVTDVWAETLSADGKAVMHDGQQVPLETVQEVIKLHNGDSVTYDVQIVPHHGPIVPTIVDGQVVPPNPSQGALSVRWTGMEPTEEFKAVFEMLEATSVDEARAALNDFSTGGQNWMLADDSGNILWTSHVKMPIRDAGALSWDAASYQGTLPCLVLPGEGGADWTGFFADDAVPWAKNPAAGYLATANQDAVGGTLDNDPSNDQHPDGHSGYLACAFDPGFREGRIQSRIESGGGKLSMDDMASIQGDARSPMGSRMVPALLTAIDSAEQEVQTGGTHPDLTAIVATAEFQALDLAGLKALLEGWRDEADYVAYAGVNLDDNQPLPLDQMEARASQATLLFNAWMPHFFSRVYGDELARMGREGSGHDARSILRLLEADPTTLATYDAVTGDSALFDDMDTPELESRNERMLRALVDASTYLATEAGPMADWRWGLFHTVRFEPLIPVWDPFAIPSRLDSVFSDGFPRHGDMFVVDASNFSPRVRSDGSIHYNYGSGPTQRFVIDLNPDGLQVKNALPGGAVWDTESSHFSDQAEQWRRNQTHDVPFVVSEVIANAESHSLAVPMN